MKNVINLHEKINYLALLVYFKADCITEVRFCRYSWLVRFKRNGANFALFCKTSIVFAPLKQSIQEIEQYLASRTRLIIHYNPVSKKFFVTERVTNIALEILTVQELGQCNLAVMIADCEFEANKLREGIRRRPYFNPKILTGTW